MQINEIFYSLQGEGFLTGLPTIFVRTSQCNLRCSYCDTTYAYDEGTEMSIRTILQTISSYQCPRVCITGGEPLLQDKTIDLIETLIENEYEPSIETNGSLDITPLLQFDTLMISCDIKCPSSNMNDRIDVENIDRLRTQDQLKFIIHNRIDYSYAKVLIDSFDISCPIIFQPVWGSDIKALASWILSDNLPVRLGLQQQKIIWGNQCHR